jgi:hypothetical protein
LVSAALAELAASTPAVCACDAAAVVGVEEPPMLPPEVADALPSTDLTPGDEVSDETNGDTAPAAAVVAVPVSCATVTVTFATACNTVVCTPVGDTGCTVGGAIGALGSAAAAAL